MEPQLIGRTEADLVVVGGGFTGLWAAIQAKEADLEDQQPVLMLLDLNADPDDFVVEPRLLGVDIHGGTRAARIIRLKRGILVQL